MRRSRTKDSIERRQEGFSAAHVAFPARRRPPLPPLRRGPVAADRRRRLKRERTGAGFAKRDSSMANKMLIDATHPEETRVVVVRGNRVEEFDFESASRRQLRGNIYLAKV